MKEELIFVLYRTQYTNGIYIATCVDKPCIPDICSQGIFMLILLYVICVVCGCL